MKIGLIVLVLVVVGLAGCAPSPNYQIRKVEPIGFAEYRFISFACTTKDDDVVSVDMQVDPQEAIDTSRALTSAQNSTSVPPGTSPGEAVAGSLIATMVVASYNQRSAYNSAQGKAESLEKLLSELGFAALLSEITMRAFAEFEAIPQVGEQAITPEIMRQLVVAHVEPKIIFDNRLVRAKIKANISLSDAHSRNNIYTNTFEYWSEPVLPDTGEPNREIYWSENQAERLRAEIDVAMAVIRAAFELDFESAAIASGEYQPAYKTLRYEDGAGSYFIRGELLGQDDSRFLVRDLRGNIKSIYGKIL